MSAPRALPPEMRRILALLRSTPSLVDLDDPAEQLLAGRLDAADAPSGYAALARVLAAAAAPAEPEELAGEAEIIARFTDAARSHPPTPIPRRASMPGKLRVRLAATVIAVLLSIGGVAAAATGLRATLAGHAGQQAPPTTRAGSNGQGRGGAAATIRDGAGLGQAAKGLCQAWESGQGASHGKREDSTAFRALAAAAGGADQVAAWCQATVGSQAAGHQAAGPDTAKAKEGLCRAWRSAQAGGDGLREDSGAFKALAAAAGGADRIAAWCQAVAPAGGSAGNGRPSAPPTSHGPPPTTGHGHG
jgi:hypothetical protein